MGRGKEDPSLALMETKSLLSSKHKNSYNHVEGDLKKNWNSKKSGKSAADYKNEMQKV